ncbi:tRNA m(1)G methyltransferase, putative [Babesia caballi]|uniref:tRNA (guanine(9)-N(1))-methyltransferase n=1 Tax=Babesia caballi TaxID=5871 RepID=A0AAV4M0E7_BABCB|nr:tRNA m(1)G methyltransferase, putative [Babesia caballi]
MNNLDRRPQTGAETRELDALTRQILREVTDIFAINCIKPWQADQEDADAVGTIKAHDFVHVARQLGCVFTASETRAIRRQLEKHNIRYINVDQFVQLIDNKVKQDHVDIKREPFTTPNEIIGEKLGELYDVIDWQKQNKLTTADLKHFLAALNDGELDQKCMETLFKSANIKFKRNITKEEFVRLFTPVDDTSYLSIKASHGEAAVGHAVAGTESVSRDGDINIATGVPEEPMRIKLPRSQKKKLAKARYREKRRERRPQYRKEKRERGQQARRTLMDGMTDEERHEFIKREKLDAEERKAQQLAFIQEAYDNGMPICVNCSFHAAMSEKESKSLARQLADMYSKIKKRQAKVKLMLTGFDTSSMLYTHLQLQNVDAWKVSGAGDNYWHLFDKNDIVVLSPDAGEYLEEVEQGKVYILGGLVDVNVKKNTTLDQAAQHGITARALPIKKYFPHCKNRVLNLTAVFEILVMRANNSTWEEAFQSCIPTRARTDNPKDIKVELGYMFKRAYLYACTAPPPEAADEDDLDYAELMQIAGDVQAKRAKFTGKGRQAEPTGEHQEDERRQNDGEFIERMPGGKVAKCKLCKGKTFLNEDAVKKHLDSKAHIKNQKRAEKDKKEAEETRRRFLKRMESLEGRIKEANEALDTNENDS